MDQNADKTSTPAVEAALGHLLKAETWSEYYDKHRSDSRSLADTAGRFQAALAGLGENYSEAEVRDALVKRAGLPAPEGFAPSATSKSEENDDGRADAEAIPGAAAPEPGSSVEGGELFPEKPPPAADPEISSEPEGEPSAEASDDDSEVMHIVDLLEELAELGVQLRCGRREDRLHVTPRDVLEAKHVAAIRSWKREIIELLRDCELEKTGVLQDERQVFEEFRKVKAARSGESPNSEAR